MLNTSLMSSAAAAATAALTTTTSSAAHHSRFHPYARPSGIGVGVPPPPPNLSLFASPANPYAYMYTSLFSRPHLL